MKSLIKTWDVAGLERWYARITRVLGHAPALIVEPKIDGVGIELRYVAGRLVSASTRSGRDLPGIDSPDLPERLAEPVDVVIRGEAWIPRSEAGAYSSPRSAAVAAIQSVPCQPVRVSVWGVEDGAYGGLDGVAVMRWLAILGLPTLGALAEATYGGEPLDGAINLVGQVRRLAPHLPCACDGAVVKVLLTADRERLGSTKAAPRWAIAYKWGGEV